MLWSREILNEGMDEDKKGSFSGRCHPLCTHSLIGSALCIWLCARHFERYINEYTMVFNFKESMGTA